MKLQGKKQNFDLSGGDQPGRSYIICNSNFLTLQKYCIVKDYDIETGDGFQREESTRHINYLEQEIINNRYTPDTFHLSISDPKQVTEKDGEIMIEMDENNPLLILNGKHRKGALEKLHKDNSGLRRKIENLPIPVMVLLDHKEQKKDFIRLNKNLAVDKSQLLNMRIDVGDVDNAKLEWFSKGRVLAKLANESENSPCYRMIRFASGNAPIAFTAVVTDRKSDLLGSFYLSSKLIDMMGQSPKWFQQLFDEYYGFVVNCTDCAAEGNLLCVPPKGARGCFNLLLATFNIFIYYLYVNGKTSPTEKDWKHIRKCLNIYDQEVDGDLSGKRRANLAHIFVQALFKEIDQDPDSNIACHKGVPVGLIINTSPSCFGVDSPGKIVLTKEEIEDDRKIAAQILAEPIYQIHLSSDTDPTWEN